MGYLHANMVKYKLFPLALYVAVIFLTLPFLPGLFHLAFSGMKASPVARHAGAGASLPGLLDEIVQHALPNSVFDWYDVALKVGAVVLGVTAAAWWDWTGRLRRESSRGGPGLRRGI